MPYGSQLHPNTQAECTQMSLTPYISPLWGVINLSASSISTAKQLSPNAFQTLPSPGPWSSGTDLTEAWHFTCQDYIHHTPHIAHTTSVTLGRVLRTHSHKTACPHYTCDLPGAQMSQSAACGLFFMAPSSASEVLSAVSMDRSSVSLEIRSTGGGHGMAHSWGYGWPVALTLR